MQIVKVLLHLLKKKINWMESQCILLVHSTETYWQCIIESVEGKKRRKKIDSLQPLLQKQKQIFPPLKVRNHKLWFILTTGLKPSSLLLEG